ncbi:hypothetical protein FSHL1_000289 [Fusarium sambucinum]
MPQTKTKDACLYELDGDQTGPSLTPVEFEDQAMLSLSESTSETIFPTPSSSGDEIKTLGYANHTMGTQNIIHLVDSQISQGELYGTKNSCQSETTSRQYTSIIRELPSRRHIDILVEAFFENVAWHYDIVDKPTVTDQLLQWRRLTHAQLKQAPASLPDNLRPFPALLFQVLAQSLLFQPIDYNECLDDLKYAADMELSDRAAEYSDAGCRLAALFGKSDLSITIVQAELLRACFEKTIGEVIEAWHTLGVAIRSAQELGLHRTEPIGSPSDLDLGHKVWLVLHLWDAHMAIVLGRPMSTRLSPNTVPLPVSWGSGSSALQKPQPRDVILCGYHTAYQFLQDIYVLRDIEDCRPLVEDIHQLLLLNIRNLPAWAVPERPRQGEPPWLSAALETMQTEIYFAIFALHRPFIFAEPSSRRRAFDAALQILESQGRLFDQAPPSQYKSFTFVFATFDAMVLLAAVHIHFKSEFLEEFPTTRKNLEWGLERLNHLRSASKLANSAFNVVRELFQKVLAAVSPVDSYCHVGISENGDSENGNLTAVEAEILQAFWNDSVQTGFGNVLPSQPLSSLLSNASSHPS